MTYSVVLKYYKENENNFKNTIDTFQSSVNACLKDGYELYGELKHGYLGHPYNQILISQALYKHDDDVYNAEFFETVPQEELKAIPKDEIVIKEILMDDGIFNVVTTENDHVLLPYGDLIYFSKLGDTLSLMQCFYKYKKTDLEKIDLRPGSSTVKELEKTFNANNAIDGGYKIKTIKNRRINKSRMRKTKSKR
jgi:hypothetical protein